MNDSSNSIVGQQPPGWQFEHTYTQLPEETLWVRHQPAPVSSPEVVILNTRLAEELGLDFDGLSSEHVAAMFAGAGLPEHATPIAQAYAGHQFGGFTMLGDGRAILLGEHRTPSGTLVDIQLKGAGRTQYSRGGDGLAALGPMLREYIISEAMAALGIPTTRSLAVASTGDPVYRTDRLPGAILTRVAASHIRVGTFQYLAARRDDASLRALADYTIERHYSGIENAPDRYEHFFREVMDRQARVIAGWQHVGFIHGVMNTDNMAISGETIDYGPCAFMNAYDPATVFSSIDHGGRYAYGNQPTIGHWNLARFAETLLSLFDSDIDKAVEIATRLLNEFPAIYEHYWLGGMRKKLGLKSEHADDKPLVQSLLDWMQQSQSDFTNTFRELSTEARAPDADPYRDSDFLGWHARWQARLLSEGKSHSGAAKLMRSANPAVIPRNHRVEEALSAAEREGDLSPLRRLLAILQNPYEPGPEAEAYRAPPEDDSDYRTFCGT